MKLITEEAQKVKFITEGTGSQKKMYIEGIFLQGDICNRNGRVYPIQTLSREVKRYNEEFIKKGRALGELSHPPTPSINLDRVSHKITSLKQEGNNFKGKAQILETPMGKIVKSLINEGVTLGVSSRGVGSLRMTNEGHKVVGEDFMLATAADIVADPSAPDAFVEGILESVDWFYDSSKNDWLVENTKRKIDRLVESREYQEKKLKLFNDFISSL